MRICFLLPARPGRLRVAAGGEALVGGDRREDRVVEQLVAARGPLADELALALEQQRHAARDHLGRSSFGSTISRSPTMTTLPFFSTDDGAAAFAPVLLTVLRVAVGERPVGGLVGAEDGDLHVPPLRVDARPLRARDPDRAVRLHADRAGLRADRRPASPNPSAVRVEAGDVAARLIVVEAQADEDDVPSASTASPVGPKLPVFIHASPVQCRATCSTLVGGDPLAALVVAAERPDHQRVLVQWTPAAMT
jgi:hypothetical protein